MTNQTDTNLELRAGDRMSRDEFHRRYLANPLIHKAELIQGVVYVPSPARVDQHAEPANLLSMWLGVFAAIVPGFRVAQEATIKLDTHNELQPDVVLFHTPPRPGFGSVRADGYFEGVPELVAEVSASTTARDLGAKKNAYEQAGVPDYLVWRTEAGAVDWFSLRDGRYVLLHPDDDGVLQSEHIPGLRLPVAALLQGDRAALLAAFGLHRAL